MPGALPLLSFTLHELYIAAAVLVQIARDQASKAEQRRRAARSASTSASWRTRAGAPPRSASRPPSRHERRQTAAPPRVRARRAVTRSGIAA